MNTEQSMHVNYTPSTATVPRTASMHPGSNDAPFYVVLLHNFGKQLEYVEDFAQCLEQFRAITADMEGKLYYHVEADQNGQQFCVYDKEKHILEARDFSYRTLMPESVWHVTENKIIRSTIQGAVELKKVWTRYRNNAFQEVWECVYNEHPRDPLHMRQGNIPCDARQFLRELYKQISANTKLSDADRNAFMWAIQSWHVLPPGNGERNFTKDEMSKLWDQCAALQHLHHTSDFATIYWIFEALNFLTFPEVRHTLTEWVDAYRKHPATAEWPTALRNAYLRNLSIVGRYVA